MKRWLVAVFAMGAGLGLCAALVFHLDIDARDAMRLWQGLSWPWIGVTAVLTVLLWWTGARKWALLSTAMHGDEGAEPRPLFFLRHFAWQNWFGNFVPPALAIVLGRGWAARHMPGVPMRAGAHSALYDQAIEFAVLLGLLPFAYLWLQATPSAVIGIGVALAGVLAVMLIVRLCHNLLPKGLRQHWLALFGWSALRVALMIARLVAGAPALGLAIAPMTIIAASSAVSLLALVPLLPGNLGMAEWGWASVLKYAGTEGVAAGLFALGVRIMFLGVQTIVLGGVEVVMAVRNKT